MHFFRRSQKGHPCHQLDTHAKNRGLGLDLDQDWDPSRIHRSGIDLCQPVRVFTLIYLLLFWMVYPSKHSRQLSTYLLGYIKLTNLQLGQHSSQSKSDLSPHFKQLLYHSIPHLSLGTATHPFPLFHANVVVARTLKHRIVDIDMAMDFVREKVAVEVPDVTRKHKVHIHPLGVQMHPPGWISFLWFHWLSNN